MQTGTHFTTIAIAAIGIAVAVITSAIIIGLRALRRPLTDEQYRGEQREAGLLGALAAGGAILLVVALIGLVFWLLSGVGRGSG